MSSSVTLISRSKACQLTMCYCCLSWHIKAWVITSWWSVNIFASIFFFLLQKPLSKSVFKKKINNKKCSEQLCNIWAYFKSFELKIDSWISCVLCSWMRLWDYSSELFKNQSPYKKWNVVVEQVTQPGECGFKSVKPKVRSNSFLAHMEYLHMSVLM